MLRLQIVLALLLALGTQPLLVSVILVQHLLEVIALLVPLVLLQGPLLIHLILQALDCLQFLCHLLFVLPPFSSLLILELQITRILIVHNLLMGLLILLLFSFLQEFVVLLSHLIIEPTLIFFVLHLHLLLLDLFVQLLANQALSLLFAQNCLLLLLKVEECVELLDCRPLVVLVYLRVLLRRWATLR